VSHRLVGVVGNLLDSDPEIGIGCGCGLVDWVRDGIGYYSLPNLGVGGGDVEMVGLG
jgi:hypothetical protein